MISFIIPCFNTLFFLKKNLHILINFCEKNSSEIVIIDDGSEDKIEEYIRTINAENIVFYKQKNSGVSSARNKGIELSTKPYIIFLDSDDIITLNTLEAHLPHIDKSDFCYWSGKKIYSNGKEAIYNTIEKMTPEELLCSLFKREQQIYIGGFCVRKMLASSVMFDTSLNYGEDLKFIFEVISQAKKISNFDDVYLLYFQRELSAINSFDNSRFDSQRAIQSVNIGNYRKRLQPHLNYLLKRDAVVIIRTLCKSRNIKNVFTYAFNSTDMKKLIQTYFGDNSLSFLAFIGYVLAYKGYLFISRK